MSIFFFSSRRRHTRLQGDWSSDVCSSDLFSLGGGFSSVDSFVGTIDLAQRNFLGRGWEVAVRLRGGGRTQQGVISFTDPWLFDRPLSGGFDLYSNTRQYTEYRYETLGSALRLGHPFFEYWRWTLGYRASQDRISGLSDVAALSAEFRDQVGARVTSAVSGAVGRDSRDNVIAPTRGGQSNVSAEFAGLGGDSKYVKTAVFTTQFYPVWFDHVLGGRVEADYGFGWADKPLPLFERVYLGGANTIPGVKFPTISPENKAGQRICGSHPGFRHSESII